MKKALLTMIVASGFCGVAASAKTLTCQLSNQDNIKEYAPITISADLNDAKPGHTRIAEYTNQKFKLSNGKVGALWFGVDVNSLNSDQTQGGFDIGAFFYENLPNGANDCSAPNKCHYSEIVVRAIGGLDPVTSSLWIAGQGGTIDCKLSSN